MWDHKAVMLGGDTHGDLRHVKQLIELARDIYLCTAIIILGDFGYWEHQPSGIYFLNYIESKIRGTGIKFYFIDGNHENHTLLRRRYMDVHDVGRDTKSIEEQLAFVERKLGPWTPTRSPEGFYAVRESVYYIPRSSIWTWNGVRFAALGGAFSIDINTRKAGTSYWPEETIEPDEVDAFYEKGTVDVFLSHDAPIETDLNAEFYTRGHRFIKTDQRTIRNRTLLSKALDFTMPKYHFHGHYHLDYMQRTKLLHGHEVEVRGLNMNGTGKRSYHILYLEDINDGHN